MKRIYIPIFLIIALSIMLFGCTPNNIDGDGYINEDGEIVGDNNDGYITEDGNVTDGGDKDDSPKYDVGNGIEDETPDGDVSGGNEEENPDGDVSGGNEDEPKDNENNNGQENLPEVGTKVGNRVADITLTTMDGEKITMSDLRGKIVILNLWATWCGPCKAELPDFDKIATEYKDNVVIIAADVDAGQGTAYTYVQQNFPNSDIVFAYDTAYGLAYYSVGGNGYVPYTAIIDQNGVIVYADSGMLSHSWLVDMIESLTK